MTQSLSGQAELNAIRDYLRQSVPVLTPNQRLARVVREAWASEQVRSGAGAWPTPVVAPIEQWLLGVWREAVASGQLPARRLLSTSQELQLWREVVFSDADSHGFSLVQPDAAAKLARQGRELLQRWLLDPWRAGVRTYFDLDLDCQTFLRWLEAFEQKLVGHAACTATDALIELGGLKPCTERLVLLEVEELPPLIEQCLDSACQQLERASFAGTPTPPAARSYASRRAELAAIADWAAARHREDPGARIAIVLAEQDEDRRALEHLMRRSFGCLGEDYLSLPVNFSTGISLDQAPLIRAAFLLLELLRPRVGIIGLIELLQSRHVPFDNDETGRARLLRILPGLSPDSIETYLLRNRLPEETGWIAARLAWVAADRERRRTHLPSAWGDFFSGYLQQWQWPGTAGLDSLEYQQLGQWTETLDEFSSFDALTGKIGLEEALSLLQRLSQQRISQPRTGSFNIQVLGPLEASGIRFDAVWVAGFHAAQWPRSARPHPLIPLAIQRSAGIPNSSAEVEVAFSRRLLEGFQTHTAEMIVSYARENEGLPMLPSPLLDPQWEVHQSDDSLIDARWLSTRADLALETYVPEAPPPVADEERLALSGGASLIEDVSQCPFRAFARHRLSVRAPETPTEGLSAGEMGNAVHRALEVLWREIGDSETLHAADTRQLQDVVALAAEAGVQTLREPRRSVVGAAALALEQQRLASLLTEWLQVEAARSEAFAVEALEQETGLSLAGVPLKLRIDRVDRLQDGRLLLLDYKTGAASKSDWKTERPFRPQLLLYSLTARDRLAAVAVASLRPRELRFLGLGERQVAKGVTDSLAEFFPPESDADTWDSLLELWRERLEDLAARFLAGAAEVDPVAPAACTWCECRPVCRIRALETSTA